MAVCSRYADVEFVSEIPDSLVCLICTFAADQPQQMDCCGKVYCKCCLDKYKECREVCPNCRQAGRSFNDKKSSREISALRVRCLHCEKGCSWCGPLSTQSHHSCRCDYEPVCCRYTEVGCTEKPLRKDLSKHEEDAQFHFFLATKAISDMKNELSSVKNELSSTKQDLTRKLLVVTQAHVAQRNWFSVLAKEVSNNNKNLFTFRMSHFRNHSVNRRRFKSLPFFSSPSGYKFLVIVFPYNDDDDDDDDSDEEDYISIYSYLLKGKNDDFLTWPFTGTVTVELLNQLEDKNHYKKSIEFPADDDDVSGRVLDARSSGYGFPKFITQSTLAYNSANKCQYLKDDTLVFRVSAKAPDHKPWLE